MHRVICITGTTGSGKNSVGARVAARLGGEVLSLDSMKVYRGMDIGTAKPSPAQRREAPHHLVDILDPTESMNVHRFVELADEVVEDVTTRGKVPVAVGGTAMYLTGFLYGLYEGPPRDPDFRAALRRERDVLGTAVLHERLAAIDPTSAEKINPNDYQRIERALEVFDATGEPPGELRRGWFETPRHDADVHFLTWPRETLRDRIFARVEAMVDAGWAEEVRRILTSGGFGETAMMALGYREVVDFVDGKIDRAALIETIGTRTWRFSRKQITWMKKFDAARVRICEPTDGVEGLVAEIEASWHRTD